MHSRAVPLIALALFSAVPARAADAPNPADTRMRDALRTSMLQLRDAQTQLATAQAAQAELEQKNKDQKAQIEKLIKEAGAEKDASKKKIDELEAKGAQQAAVIAQLQTVLEEWKAAHKKAETLAMTTEAERQRLAALSVALQRRVADQQTRNAAMFKIGSEILERYEKFSFGAALAAREPFVGITRVKLQGLFQDYKDNLVDARITPPGAQTLQREAGLPRAKAGVKESDRTKKP